LSPVIKFTGSFYKKAETYLLELRLSIEFADFSLGKSMSNKKSWPRGISFDFTPEGCALTPTEYWNSGIMEYWKSKADDGLILCSDSSHLYKNRSHSAKPSIPTFQCSIIPRHMITAQPNFSDLAQRTRALMLE
jgi:hypothetical protein